MAGEICRAYGTAGERVTDLASCEFAVHTGFTGRGELPASEEIAALTDTVADGDLIDLSDSGSSVSNETSSFDLIEASEEKILPSGKHITPSSDSAVTVKTAPTRTPNFLPPHERVAAFRISS